MGVIRSISPPNNNDLASTQCSQEDLMNKKLSMLVHCNLKTESLDGHCLGADWALNLCRMRRIFFIVMEITGTGKYLRIKLHVESSVFEV